MTCAFFTNHMRSQSQVIQEAHGAAQHGDALHFSIWR